MVSNVIINRYYQKTVIRWYYQQTANRWYYQQILSTDSQQKYYQSLSSNGILTDNQPLVLTIDGYQMVLSTDITNNATKSKCR